MLNVNVRAVDRNVVVTGNDLLDVVIAPYYTILPDVLHIVVVSTECLTVKLI